MINNDNNIYNSKYTHSHFTHSVSGPSGKQHWLFFRDISPWSAWSPLAFGSARSTPAPLSWREAARSLYWSVDPTWKHKTVCSFFKNKEWAARGHLTDTFLFLWSFFYFGIRLFFFILLIDVHVYLWFFFFILQHFIYDLYLTFMAL